MKILILTLGLLLSSCFAFAKGNYRAYLTAKEIVNKQGDAAVIYYFHQQNPTKPYIVLDKKTNVVTVYSADGQAESKAKVQTYPGDELEKGGAGIYTYAGQKKNVHYARAEKDNSVHGIFNGKLRLPSEAVIYVLPSSNEHRFRIRNQQVAFNAARVLRDRQAFNYSPLNPKAAATQITVDFEDSFTQAYVKTLQDEKPKLMRLLELENDECNMLAEFAFGVLAPETEYGTSWSYLLKQRIPIIVSIAKGNGFNTDENSRGPTQMKTIPPVITENYGIEKHQLYYPENAAIATLAFAADLLKEIRNRAPQHKGITEETLQDYMYYLYQGRRYEIKGATATPDANLSIRRIREAIEHISIDEAY